MKTLDLVQGSPEWHAHRAAHHNASDAPAMLGVSQYNSRTQLLRVAFDAPRLLPPEAGRHGQDWSVEQINGGAVPWLRSEEFVDAMKLAVPAGATLAEFVETIEAAGGTVYGPLGWAELPPWQRPDIVAHT